MKCEQWKEVALLQQPRGSEWSQCVRLASSLNHTTLIVYNLPGLWDLCGLPFTFICTWMRNKSKSKHGTFCLSAKTTVWLYYCFIRAQNHSRHKYWRAPIRAPDVVVLPESLQPGSDPGSAAILGGSLDWLGVRKSFFNKFDNVKIKIRIHFTH